jgi:hypothetical protein
MSFAWGNGQMNGIFAACVPCIQWRKHSLPLIHDI